MCNWLIDNVTLCSDMVAMLSCHTSGVHGRHYQPYTTTHQHAPSYTHMDLWNCHEADLTAVLVPMYGVASNEQFVQYRDCAATKWRSGVCV